MEAYHHDHYSTGVSLVNSVLSKTFPNHTHGGSTAPFAVCIRCHWWGIGRGAIRYAIVLDDNLWHFWFLWYLLIYPGGLVMLNAGFDPEENLFLSEKVIDCLGMFYADMMLNAGFDPQREWFFSDKLWDRLGMSSNADISPNITIAMIAVLLDAGLMTE